MTGIGPSGSGAGSGRPPSWRLPPGVDGPLWDYAASDRLAADESTYFEGHPLLEADARFLVERFVEPGPLADLGCGNGRLALRFARLGFPVVAVDLSRPSLAALASKAAADGLPILPVRADLCRLGALPSDHFTYALAMFSTFGMIRGAPARRLAVAEASRLLRPGGRLALHAHNSWDQARDPQGLRWLLADFALRCLRHPEFGDRRMTYRGIPNLAVHLYRWPELLADLRSAGLVVEETIALDSRTARPIGGPRWLHGWRAGGWIVVARKG